MQKLLGLLDRIGEEIIALTEKVDALEGKKIYHRKEKTSKKPVVQNYHDGVYSPKIGTLTIDPINFSILEMNDLLKKVGGDQVGMTCFRVFYNRESVCDNCQVVVAAETGEITTRIHSINGRTFESTAIPIIDKKTRKLIHVAQIMKLIVN